MLKSKGLGMSSSSHGTFFIREKGVEGNAATNLIPTRCVINLPNLI